MTVPPRGRSKEGPTCCVSSMQRRVDLALEEKKGEKEEERRRRTTSRDEFIVPFCDFGGSRWNPAGLFLRFLLGGKWNYVFR